jgi:ADP-heptose:LPS heptosyltransferase
VIFVWNKRPSIGLKDATTILVILPDGLGDMILWAPVLSYVLKEASQAKIIFPLEFSHFLPILRLVEGLSERFEFVGSRVHESPCLAILMSDNGAILGSYQTMIRRAPFRIGLAGGVHRKELMTHSAKRPFFARSNHEGLRNQGVISLLGGGAKKNLLDLLGSVKPVPFGHEDSDLHLPKDYVVMHLFSNGHGREWPLQNFETLARNIIDQGMNIILTGSRAESSAVHDFYKKIEPLGSVLNLAGRQSLGDLISVLRSAKCVIAGSTGPLHLASFLGVKTIGLFPPRKGLNPNRWGPIGALSCAIHVKACAWKKCSNRECSCMEKLKPEWVVQALKVSRYEDLRNEKINVWSAV